MVLHAHTSLGLLQPTSQSTLHTSHADSWLGAGKERAASTRLTWHSHHCGSLASSLMHQVDFQRLLLADETASPPSNKGGTLDQVPRAAHELG